jgi:hypothetical protein
LAAHLTEAYGAEASNLYRDIFEKLRQELGYAEYLGALQRFRLEKMHDPRVLRMSSWLVDYPFADRLYAGALNVIKHVRQWGPAVILSDGDAVFQPRKVEMQDRNDEPRLQHATLHHSGKVAEVAR